MGLEEEGDNMGLPHHSGKYEVDFDSAFGRELPFLEILNCCRSK